MDAAASYLHSMWAAVTCPQGAVDYVDEAYNAHRSKHRLAHERSFEAFLVDGRSAATADVETRRLRRAMEPVIEADFVRLMPDLFVVPERIGQISVSHEVLVVRRERCSFSRKRTDLRSCPGHLALSRHALERVHERSLLDGEDLETTIRAQAGHADRALAFAWASGIHLGAGPTDHGAATAIPFLDGLLLVQNRVVAMRRDTNPAEWREIRAAGVFSHRIPLNPLTTVPLPDMWGREVVGHVVAVAATFVAGDMMRAVQEGYRDWFMRTMTRHAHEIPEAAARITGCIEHHRLSSASRMTIEVPDLGRRLLHEVVSQRRRQPLLMSIGWNRSGHPATW